MRAQDITLEVRDKTLVKKGTITSKFMDLQIKPVVRGVGTWTVKLPASHPMVAELATPGSGIVVSLHGTEYFSGPTLKPAEATNHENPDGTYTFTGVSDDCILAHALAYPQPSNANEATQNVANDVRTGKAETLMRAFVHYNIAGADAGPPPAGRLAGLRNYLKVEAVDGLRGPTVTKSPRFQNLGELLGELGVLGGLNFRVIQRGQFLQFEVLTMTDVSSLVRFDIDSGTLTSTSIEISAPTITRAIVAGQGEGTARQILKRTTADSVAAETAWGLVIEEFIDQRNTDVTAELQQSGDERLLENGFTATAVKAIPADDQTMKLVTDWDLGYKVGLVTYGQLTTAYVTEVVIIANSQRVSVGCAIGDVTGFDPKAALAGRVADTQRRVSALERTIELSGDTYLISPGDPNVDAIIFWDDSAGGHRNLTLGAPLTITGTALSIDAATTAAAGIAPLATNAEALALASTTKIVTPDDLKYVRDQGGFDTRYYTETEINAMFADRNILCYLGMSAAQNCVGGGVRTAVNWDVEVSDASNLHDNATNPSRITVNKTGRWRATAFTIITTTSSYNDGDFAVNGTALARGGGTMPGTAGNHASRLMVQTLILTSGDYVQHRISSGSVTAINVSASFFQLEYLGP